MKILVICDFYKESTDNTASFRVRWLSAEALARKGNDVVFIYPTTRFTFNRNKSLVEIGMPGLPFKALRRGGFSLLDCLWRTLLVFILRPDVVWTTNGHRPNNFLPCMVARHLFGSYTIDETWEWLGNGGYASQRHGILGRMLALYDVCLEVPLKEMFDRLIVISSELKKIFRAQDKVAVLWGGAENSRLQAYSINEARESLGISPDMFIIGMSSVVKGDHEANKTFFEGFAALCQDHDNVNVLMTGSDQEYIQWIGLEYGFHHRIIYPGYLSFEDYNRYLSSCNIFVLPYPDTQINRGRWPNKFSDYMCLERPVVTNPTGDVNRFVDEYGNGVLCQHDADSYLHILNSFLTVSDVNSLISINFKKAKDRLSLSGRVDCVLSMVSDTSCSNGKSNN